MALFGSRWYQKKAQTGFFGALASFFRRLPFSPVAPWGAAASFFPASFGLDLDFEVGAAFLVFSAATLVAFATAFFSRFGAAFLAGVAAFGLVSFFSGYEAGWAVAASA